MTCDVSLLNRATGEMPALIPQPPPGKPSRRYWNWTKPQTPTSKSKLPPTLLSAGLWRAFDLHFSPESCDDQFHNATTSQILSSPLGPALDQRVEQSSSPRPALSSGAASCCCVCTLPLPATRDCKQTQGTTREAAPSLSLFRLVSLRNERRPAWICGRPAVGAEHRKSCKVGLGRGAGPVKAG